MGNHPSINDFNRGSDSDLYCQRKPKAPRTSAIYTRPLPPPPRSFRTSVIYDAPLPPAPKGPRTSAVYDTPLPPAPKGLRTSAVYEVPLPPARKPAIRTSSVINEAPLPKGQHIYATPVSIRPSQKTVTTRGSAARLKRSGSVRRSGRQMKGRAHKVRSYHHPDKKTAQQIALERELEFADDKKELFAAAERGDVEKVEELLDSGIDVNSVDANQMTPLHHAAMHARHKVIQVLVDRGADVNASDMKGGFTALHWVVINADPLSIEHVDESVVALSRGGCDINATDFNLASPLHYAAQKDLRGCVDTLMRLGADPLQVDITGRNCIRVAKSGETRDLIQKLRRMKENVIYHVLEVSPSPDTPPPTPPPRRWKVPTKP